MKKDDFINTIISNENKKRKISLSAIFCLWFVLSATFVFLITKTLTKNGALISSNRIDINFHISLASIILVATISSYSAYFLSTPRNSLKRKILYSLLLSVTLWFLSVASIIYFEIINIDISRLIPTIGLTCTRNILLMGILPVITLLLLIRKEYPTRLSEVDFYSIIAGFSFGALGTHFTCPTDNGTHILVWHILPIFILSLVGRLIGKNILKW